MRYHLVNLLRQVRMPEHVAIKRILRLGKWRGNENLNMRRPRPVLVEFANPRHRDTFLSAADFLRRESHGAISVAPDHSAGWKFQPSDNYARTLHVTRPQPPYNPVVRLQRLSPQRVNDTVSRSVTGNRKARPISTSNEIVRPVVSDTPRTLTSSTPLQNQRVNPQRWSMPFPFPKNGKAPRT
jgi:hypothetical protein